MGEAGDREEVLMPPTVAESWTVLAGELEPLAPAEQYLQP